MQDFEHTHYSLQKRIIALIIAISSIFFVLFVRIIWLQGFRGNSLQMLAYDQWTRSLPITSERGGIFDTNGASLAVSYTTYSIYIRAREIKDASKVSYMLSKELGINYDEIYQKAQMITISEVLVKLNVESTLAKKILAYNYSGVYLSESVNRYYPYGDLLTQILGFTTIDNIGQAGIEAFYDKILKGVNGSYLVQSDLTGTEIENSLQTYIEPTAGSDIYITIDVNIQSIVENVLNTIMLEQKPKSCSCIVMKAKTGEIVASSTKPSFDLNNVPRDDVPSLLTMTNNSLVTNVYEPGSTFKILTMAAALESGVADLDDTFYCRGSSVVDGQKIKCWKTKGHGTLTLEEGLVNSCNVVFMELAQRLGTERFYEFLKKFGIGSKTGIDVFGESSGILMNQNYVKTVDLARIGFGQAVAVTPVQLLSSVCGVVNGGNLITPTLTKSFNKNNNFESKIRNDNVISKNSSAILNKMLASVVNKTGDYSFVSGYDVGGKTGTAQKYENGAIAQGKYVSSFIGTFPATNPEYAMIVLVDEPSAGQIYGSLVAMPYGKIIFQNMIDYLGIDPIIEKQSKFCVMPLVEGKDIETALMILEEKGFICEIYGEGEKIRTQLPPAGTNWDINMPVVLQTI